MADWQGQGRVRSYLGPVPIPKLGRGFTTGVTTVSRRKKLYKKEIRKQQLLRDCGNTKIGPWLFKRGIHL